MANMMLTDDDPVLVPKSGKGPIPGLRTLDVRGRAPRVYRAPEVRRCQECGIVLSMYNKGPNCYTHSPVKFKRVRGITGAS